MIFYDKIKKFGRPAPPHLQAQPGVLRLQSPAVVDHLLGQVHNPDESQLPG